MARALKVFSTPAGFFTAVVAAPSQKAALEAWGVRDNLFATGAAIVVTDPDLVAAALARPGEILRIPLPDDLPAASPTAQTPAPPAPRPPPDRAALTRAEATLERETRRSAKALDALQAERAALDAREARLRADVEENVRRATAALKVARRAYDADAA